VTYDSFKLLFQAIQNQGKADPESIRQGLSEIEQYDGVAGIIKYQDTGDPLVSLVILQVKGDRSTVYKRFDP
jgi:ABC-type branched-subunit amino acid transport system substrate-binding protein